MSILPSLSNCSIAILGLGYVGLPLAVAFGKTDICHKTGTKLKRNTIGFDINKTRIEELVSGYDRTEEINKEDLEKLSDYILLTSEKTNISNTDVFIVTVPTPIDEQKNPDLSPLTKVSTLLGNILKTSKSNGQVIIFESTVYPGVTEEVCAPIIADLSGKLYNKDFFCGYSPERINPGDKLHCLQNIVKVTSGSNPEVAQFVDNLYASIIKAGTHLAQSIKVAEAAKVIENTQRDINIALMNELSIIFNHLNINTEAVLAAASTKWNFLSFKPGLVGGHCIGVDPYYLTYCSQKHGYEPKIILSGRELNDNMGNYIATSIVKLMSKKDIVPKGSKVLVLGLSFKENCPDLRNSGVCNIIYELQTWGCDVDVFDPVVSNKEAVQIYGFNMLNSLPLSYYDSIVLAVSHMAFEEMGAERLLSTCKSKRVVFDVKSLLPVGDSDMRL